MMAEMPDSLQKMPALSAEVKRKNDKSRNGDGGNQCKRYQPVYELEIRTPGLVLFGFDAGGALRITHT